MLSLSNTSALWLDYFALFCLLYWITPGKPFFHFPDIDECLKNNGGCDKHAKCTNTIGSRTCKCNKGFTGTGLKCIGKLDIALVETASLLKNLLRIVKWYILVFW